MEKLYNQLYKDGKYTKTFEDFKSQFGTPETSEKLYTALNEAGDYTKSFDDFKSQFNIAGKTSDPVNVEATAGSEDDMASSSENGLSAWQSIKNSFSNAAEQIGDIGEFWFDTKGDGGGAQSSLDIATNAVYSGIFGQDALDDYVERKGKDSWVSQGLGSENTLESIKKYEKEKQETKETLGIIESVKKGDIGGTIAGGINALTSMIGSVAYGAGTLGTGFFMDYVAENYIEFNKLKAENLGISFEELVKDGKADNGIPVGMGAVSTGLELVGLGTVLKASKGAVKGAGNTGLLGSANKYLAEKLIYSSSARKAMSILGAGSTEFTTEILQHAADEVNREFGSVAGTDKKAEVGRAFIDAVTSQEGLEAGIQGFIGGSGVVGGSYSAKAMSTVRSTVDGDKIDKDITELSRLRNQYKNATDKSVKEGIQAEIDKKESEIADSIRKGNEIYNSLSDEQISEIESLTDLADVAAFKITDLNKKLRRGDITQSEYDSASIGFKNQYEQARQSLIDMNLDKNIEFAKKEAESRGLKFRVYETTDALQKAMNRFKTSKENKQEFKDNKGNIHGFSVGNQIFINKEVASKQGAINVGAHEFLHPIFNKLIGDVENQGKYVRQFRKSMTSAQRRFVDNKMRERGYTSQDQYNTEYINVFSDALRNKQINYDKNTFEKIGDAVLGIFKPKGYENASFKSGKEVYNFIKEYDKSIQEGKLTESAKKALGDVDLSDAKLKGSMQMSRDADAAEVNKIYDNTPDKTQAGFEIAQKYRGMAESVFKQLRDGQNLTPDQQEVLNQNKEDIIAMMLYDKIPSQRESSKARNVLGLVQDFVKEKQKYRNVAAYINTFFKDRSKEVTQYFIPDAVLEGMETQEGNLKRSVATKTADQKTTKPQGPKARKITSFEKLTIDGEEFYTPAMKAEVAKRVAANVSINARKGLNVNEVVKSIEEDVKTVIRDVIKKQMGKVSKVKGETVISPEYQNFLDQSYEMFVKSMPLSTIKRRYSKLFKLKKLGREKTAVGKGIFQMTKPTKQEFNTFFTKGGYTTLIERQKGIAVAMAEEFAANETSRLSIDQNFLEKIASILEISDVALVPEAQLQQLIKDIAKAQDRKVSEARGFDQTLQFSKTMFETNQTDKVTSVLNFGVTKQIIKNTYLEWKQTGKPKSGKWLEEALRRILPYNGNIEQAEQIAKELAGKQKGFQRNITALADARGIDLVVEDIVKFVIDPDANNSVEIINAKLGIKSQYDGKNLGHVNEARALAKKLKDAIGEDSFIKSLYQGFVSPARLANFQAKKTPDLFIKDDQVTIAKDKKTGKDKKNYYSLFADVIDAGKNLLIKSTAGKFRDGNQTKKNWFFSKVYNKLSDAGKIAFTKKLLKSAQKEQKTFLKVVDVLRESYKDNSASPQAIEGVLLSMFGVMTGLGKAMAGIKYLPVDPVTGKLLTMEDLFKMDLAFKNDPGVFEHMKPADYIKGLAYYYITTGKGLDVLTSELESYDIAIIPERVDKVITGRGNQSYMGLLYKPGVNTFGPGQRYRGLGISFMNIETGEIVRSGLQFSRSSQQRQNLNKAIELARDPNKKEKGISVFDFDDTLAQTNSMVIVKMPDGKTIEIDATRFALESADLEAAGAIFDFSQFNQVIDGKKGPLFDLATRRQDKFTSKDIFVLTARPQEAAIAIHAFLKGMGLNIPMKNIVGLADGRPEAKSDWIISKAAEGYNNFYFADDAYKNVKAVQDVLNQIDVKSDVQQAFVQFSRTMDESFNDILEETKGVKSEARFSDAAARARGAKKGNFFKNLFIPPSAEDFVGLLYSFLAKGKKGEQQMAFFEKALIKPFARAMQELAAARQVYASGLRSIKKAYPDVTKRLAKPTKYNEFNHDTAIRAYIWNKLGYDIPGMSKTDIKRLTELVENDPGLKAFAQDLMDLTQDRKYVQPGESWLAGNIATDIKDITDKVGRKEFLKQWINNKNVIFSKENMNKIEAIYGKDFREALEDMLYRMENGTNRNFGGQSRLVNSFTNWVNNSVGAIMFFNIRSAVLQTISMVNFVNWSDNNPVAAGAALLNVKQFAKDFATIFNSDMLKQRRRGIGRDINESEIAEAMYGKRNKPKAILNYLLRIGFTPTQIADSFAIAAGGASFYRNRIKTYMKKGISRAEAEKQAFADFAEISEKTQQSARPDLISQQQAGPLGRLILAFQNTPMQYTRLIKKAFLDLVNGRGDMKTNISKIAYYGFVQNLIFASMQSALFALMFTDEEEDEDFAENKKERVANSMVDTLLRGTGVYGAGIATIKNMIKRFVKEEEKDFGTDHTYTIIEAVNLSPPVGSKLRKLYSGIQTYRFNKDLISHKGFALDNPAYQAGGNVVSALTNVPLDRLFNKMNNLRASMNNNNEAWQRIALALGWNTWDVDAELDPELDKLKEFLKKKRKADQKKDPDYAKKRLEKLRKKRKEQIKKLKNK